ncbi:MAG: hypothetical protein KDB22_20560 [Planctomycetales bacterium]|nr:hypothetical protein [Planctomycetales bacterium]
MTRLLFSVTLGLVLLGRSLSAAVVFDSGGFEGYANGGLLNQFGWVDFNPPNANRFSVQSSVSNGGTRAVAVTDPSAVAAFIAPAVNYTPVAGELVLVEVDIARNFAQFPFQASSPGFAVDIYDPNGNRIAGFGLGMTANNSAIRPFVTRGDGLTVTGVEDDLALTVATNQFVSFKAELDFGANQFRLFANGTDMTGLLPFVNNASVLGDADLQHDSAVGAQDVGYFDNYRITTVTAVPEPGSGLACVTVLLGVVTRRRR